MKKQLMTGAIAAGAMAIGWVGLAGSAEAATFGFSNIFLNSNNTSGDTLVNNFSVDVTDAGSGNVLFKIISAAANPAGSFIRQVYFDDASPSLLSNMVLNVSNTGIVNFNPDNNGTLPQFNDANPPFVTSFGGVRAQGANNRNAIQRGEALGVQFTGNFNNVIAALNSGSLRVGIHLQGIPPVNSSDSFVTTATATAVPTPALLPGLIGMGITALRKKKQSATQEA
jgi:hypothetical protein